MATSFFSFSCNFFYPFQQGILILSYIHFVVCKYFESGPVGNLLFGKKLMCLHIRETAYHVGWSTELVPMLS